MAGKILTRINELYEAAAETYERGEVIIGTRNAPYYSPSVK